MQTMLFRYSIMVDVFNARLPQELLLLPSKIFFPQRVHFPTGVFSVLTRLKFTYSPVSSKPYTEQIDRLIFLYGVGVLNTESLKSLVLHNDSDFLDDTKLRAVLKLTAVKSSYFLELAHNRIIF